MGFVAFIYLYFVADQIARNRGIFFMMVGIISAVQRRRRRHTNKCTHNIEIEIVQIEYCGRSFYL